MAKPSAKLKKHTKQNASKNKDASDEYRPTRNAGALHLNKAPIDNQRDDSMSRKTREIAKFKELGNQPKKRSKKVNKNVDAMTATANQFGFERRAWETDKAFKIRIKRETKHAVDEDMLKARYGMGGRDVKEIQKEYKAIDEAAQRKKNLKLMQKEKRQKLMLKKNKRFDNDLDSVPAKTKIDKPEDSDKEEDEKPSKKKCLISRKDRQKILKREAEEQKQHDFMLNAREVIPFGEVANAPPQFKGALKAKIDPLSAQAGSKDLLLKKLLTVKKSNVADTPLLTQNKSESGAITEEERQNVVNLYRELKRKRINVKPINS